MIDPSSRQDPKLKELMQVVIDVIVIDVFLSQLYSSITVVVAIYGLHWKWQSLTPCQRHLSEQIEKCLARLITSSS